MNLKAKFQCTGLGDQPDYKQKFVVMIPVISGSEENKSFAKYTPSGRLDLCLSYETPASDFFEVGKEYYLTIDKVEQL